MLPSVNRDVFIKSLRVSTRIFHFWRPLFPGGSTGELLVVGDGVFPVEATGLRGELLDAALAGRVVLHDAGLELGAKLSARLSTHRTSELPPRRSNRNRDVFGEWGSLQKIYNA